ncbi:MAG TPA: hypothetical protein VFN53_10575 [Acidobacteriaceae bacterium]|nr:hypothetical protein [Acidobacteriaceae bacterium]
MRRPTWISLAVVIAVVAALLVTVDLRKHAPPEVARLLPEADAIVYFNLTPLRSLTQFNRHPVAHSAEYQAFVQATGFEFERDLDQAAFALHRMDNPTGPNGPVAYSEVFSGHFDGPRLNKWLTNHAAATDRYSGHDIYSIPREGRIVRVVLLGYDLVAASNTPTPEQIHSIIDRYHSAASPFSGDTLLSDHYRNVPLLSQVWGIGKIGLPFASGKHFEAFGLRLPIPADSTFIASIRYLGSLNFRLEEIASTDRMAKLSVGVANLALGLMRSAQVTGESNGTAAGEWNSLLKSASVQQKGNRAVLKAVIPIGLVRDLVAAQTEAEGDGNGAASMTSPSPAPN